MRYFLSNRQLKELIIRAVPIRVALPAPAAHSEKNWALWARNVLPPEVAVYVSHAQEARLIIRHRPDAQMDCLTDLLGEIIDCVHPTHWLITTIAIVVDLQVGMPRTSGAGKIQWPMNVEIAGKKLFGEVISS